MESLSLLYLPKKDDIRRRLQDFKEVWEHGDDKKIFAELLAREDVKMFVVDEGGKLLGFCDFFIVPVVRRGYLQGHIEDLVVDESARGRGVGTLLLKKLIQFSRERGIKVIKLTSGLELVDAHKFYGKNGFKFTEKMFRFDV